jgi:hypothetical protein
MQRLRPPKPTIALARVQAFHPTQTRVELMRQIRVCLSADELGADPMPRFGW